MKKFLVATAFLALALAVPAFAQSGFTGWQSGVFNTGGGTTIMPVPADTTLRNYFRKLFCDATMKTTPGPMQMNIKATQGGVVTNAGYFAVPAGQTDQIEFDPPVWGDVGTAITMTYATGSGGPTKCMWMGFRGQ